MSTAAAGRQMTLHREDNVYKTYKWTLFGREREKRDQIWSGGGEPHLECWAQQ